MAAFGRRRREARDRAARRRAQAPGGDGPRAGARRALADLGDVDPATAERIEHLSRSLVKKLLHSGSTVRLRERAGGGDADGRGRRARALRPRRPARAVSEAAAPRGRRRHAGLGLALARRSASVRFSRGPARPLDRRPPDRHARRPDAGERRAAPRDRRQGALHRGARAEALREGTIDLAVRSLKDLPTEEVEGVALGPVCLREDVRDCLVSRGGPLRNPARRRRRHQQPPPLGAAARAPSRPRGALDPRQRRDPHPQGARGRLRRGAPRGRRHRPPRGSTRSRSGWTRSARPGARPGCARGPCRADDAATLELLAAVDDPAARAATTAERAFLRALGAGARRPSPRTGPERRHGHLDRPWPRRTGARSSGSRRLEAGRSASVSRATRATRARRRSSGRSWLRARSPASGSS